MPAVTVNTYAGLRQYLDGNRSVEVEIGPNAIVRDVLAQLAIPVERTKIIVVNGRPTTLEKSLVGGEKIDLFSAAGGG